jgi:hypothetical protein
MSDPREPQDGAGSSYRPRRVLITIALLLIVMAGLWMVL